MTKKEKTNVAPIATRPDVTWTPELKDGKFLLHLSSSQHSYAQSSIVLANFFTLQADFFAVHVRGITHPFL